MILFLRPLQLNCKIRKVSRSFMGTFSRRLYEGVAGKGNTRVVEEVTGRNYYGRGFAVGGERFQHDGQKFAFHSRRKVK